jgi:hypothetical protein
VAVNQRTELTVQSWRPITTPSPVAEDSTKQAADQTLPLSTDDIAHNTSKEFQRLRRSVDSLSTAAPQAASAAPLNPLDGMVRYATGAWATALGVTKGLFARIAGAWHRVLTENAGLIQTGAGTSTENAALELGTFRTGDGYAFIDLHTSVGTDFNARLIRNPGVNGEFSLQQVGTGNTAFYSNGVASFVIAHAGGASWPGLYNYSITSGASSFTTAGVLTGRELRFAQNVGDNADAGVIGYRRYGSFDSLDIVGAGAAVPRKILLYDNVTVNGSLTAVNDVTANGNMGVTGTLFAGAASVGGGGVATSGGMSAASIGVTGNIAGGSMTSGGLPVVTTVNTSWGASSVWQYTNDRILHQGGFEVVPAGFTSTVLIFPITVGAMFSCTLTPVGNAPVWLSGVSNSGATINTTFAGGLVVYWAMMGAI